MHRLPSCSPVPTAALALLAVAVVAGVPARGSSPAPDCLGELGSAMERFRGVGYPEVVTYRVDLHLPEDETEESVPLEEIWRAPGQLVLRASRPGTHRAIVRSLALYLEPVYVARSSLIDTDWAVHVERIRELSTVECTEEDGVRTISVRFEPRAVASDLPEIFRELRSFRATLDRHGRLTDLHAVFRAAGEKLALSCEYRGGKRPQPDLAIWTLPNGGSVRVKTTFRAWDDRILPDSRVVTFPSRYDPGETEEIEVRYANYRIDTEIPDDAFLDPAAFRYDENGLVSE